MWCYAGQSLSVFKFFFFLSFETFFLCNTFKCGAVLALRLNAIKEKSLFQKGFFNNKKDFYFISFFAQSLYLVESECCFINVILI